MADPTFDAAADTPAAAAAVTAGDQIPFVRKPAGVWETITPAELLAALILLRTPPQLRADLGLTDLATAAVGANLTLAGGVLSAPGGGGGSFASLTGQPGDNANLAAALALKAALASPAFTGVPTAPTAAPGTNTTQLATAAFVQAALAALVNSAPGVLDTLNELAAALGNDPDFAATITALIAGKQPLDADLTQLAGLTGTGYARRTGPDTWTLDTPAAGGSAAPRPDPALDLAAAGSLLPAAADLLADDSLAVVTADGAVKRVRADALFGRAKVVAGDDLLDTLPAGLWWPDLDDFYTTAAQTTKTVASNAAAFPGQDQNVYVWRDRSGNGRHLTNQVVADGRLTVDFCDSGRPAVQTRSAFTLGLAGIASLLPATGWTVCVLSSKDATAADFATGGCALSVGKSGTNDYAGLVMRRTDIGGASGGNVTHRFFGSVSGGWGGTLDDGNIADPGRRPVFLAAGFDGTNYWFLKQDGTVLTSAGAHFSPDQIGVGWLYRSSYGFYQDGHAVAAGLWSRSLRPPDLARVRAEFERRASAPKSIREKATFAARFGGPAGAKLRQVTAPPGALAATVGSVGVAAPAANGSGPGAAVAGGTCLKVGRSDFGRFGGWPARGNWWVAFHGTVTTLPGAGDSHLVGQWSALGRVWRLVVTSTGAVRGDVVTTTGTPTVQSITDPAGLTNGAELRAVLAWNRDLQRLELNVNARAQVTQSYGGPNWSINDAEPFGPVTVGAGWSGSGSNDKDAAFAGAVHAVHAGRGRLTAGELALFLTAGGFETRRLPGPSLRITHRDPHYWWGGAGVKAASPTIEGVYAAPDGGGSISYSLDGGAPAVGVASPTGRTFSFTVPNIPAGRHTLEVWFTSQPGVRDAIRVNVGPVVVVAGQSLAPMASAWPTRFDGPSGYVSVLDQTRRWQRPGTAEITGSCFGALDLSSLSAGFSDWARVAGRTAARLGLPVGVVIASQSGTESQSWAPNAIPTLDTTLFGQMLRLASVAGGCDLVWWDQGQNDAAFGVSQGQHETRLTAVVDGVWANLACNTAVVVMPETTAGYAANVPAIQAAQAAVITAHARAVAGSNEDGLTPAGDGVHWGSSTDEATARAELDARVERHAAALAALGY